jgi:hypothetical protein
LWRWLYDSDRTSTAAATGRHSRGAFCSFLCGELTALGIARNIEVCLIVLFSDANKKKKNGRLKERKEKEGTERGYDIQKAHSKRFKQTKRHITRSCYKNS